ncbi:MAG TPA: hypothetical protein PLN93_14575, partial [Vicinamibacterales bacterium]|nr:hypothetical protein [Vicinamibacterales bacterium]
MRGEHLAHAAPEPDSIYALTLDVAGQANESESRPADPGGRDCTACTLFAVTVGRSREPLAGRPRYSVAQRWWWRGVGQAQLYERLTAIVETWMPRRIVVDATGLGAGLASFLTQRFGARVLPYTFTVATKSQLGWAFLGICDTGRFKDHALDGSPAQAEFWQQVRAAQYELLPGPGRRLRWGARPGRGHD